tara:strand:- start:2377 stop:3729 length:1353 start_codon:yes stop_codon:yes gene_type:complete
MASTYLSKTLAGTRTNGKKWTWSAWVKRNATGSIQPLFYADDGSANYYTTVRFHDTDSIVFRNKHSSDQGYLITTRLFRDTGAWYHIQAVYDSDNSTSGDRMILYVNGERITAYDNEAYPGSSAGSTINDGYQHRIGRGNQVDGSSYFDGCMSHVHFVDGQAYAPTVFGETDATTGIWKINTNPTVTYGINGFFILKNSNAVTDQSPNSNAFAVSGGTLLTTQDNPSNNFPTINRMLSATPPTSKGCLTITKTNSGYKPGLSTFGAHSGKYYAEFKLETASGYTNFGVVNAFKKKALGTGSSLDYIGDGNDGVAYQPGSSSLYYNGSSQGSYGSASQGDIIGIALDIDNGYVYWSKNGTFLNSGVPTSGGSGTGGFALSNIADTQFGNYYIFGVSVAGTSGTRTVAINYGQGFFGTTAVASAGNNASGHGVFEYDVPTGYTALCTKGLNE